MNDIGLRGGVGLSRDMRIKSKSNYKKNTHEWNVEGNLNQHDDHLNTRRGDNVLNGAQIHL